jgi:CO/xanthine dehydrogenase Mo-binding subunit
MPDQKLVGQNYTPPDLVATCGSPRLPLRRVAVGDVGTVTNPRSRHGQLLGGINLGVGHALMQKWVYDASTASRSRSGSTTTSR